MGLFEKVLERSSSQCEICSNTEGLSLYEIQPAAKSSEETSLMLCQTCRSQIEHPETMDPNHWRALSQSMWSEHPPVQVLSWRALSLLASEDWARELLDQLYLDESLLEFAKAGLPEKEESEEGAPTLDSNGTRLQEGDSVTLIKDLDVKGAGFTAKRGTLVKNISLTNNPKHIEGRVNGIQIVLVAAYLKKA